MPRLNLGTCCGSDPAVGIPTWFAAGGSGVSGVDTAFDYGDQAKIGQLLAATGKDRSEFFVTTKVPAGVGVNEGNASDCRVDPSVALWYVQQDLSQLGLDHVDLVLLHGPCRFGTPEQVPDPTAADNALWSGLQTAMAMGLTRAIGVSNYNATELAALSGAVPSVNQCQMSVGTARTTLPMPRVAHDDATLAYCKAHNVTYEAWRVLGGCPTDDPAVKAAAAAHAVSAAQVCVRWVLQRGAVIASGTGADAALAAQFAKEDLGTLDAFSLTDAEMDALSKVSPCAANK
jgi:2,5-diketo-D-gluconate reductase A